MLDFVYLIFNVCERLFSCYDSNGMFMADILLLFFIGIQHIVNSLKNVFARSAGLSNVDGAHSTRLKWCWCSATTV